MCWRRKGAAFWRSCTRKIRSTRLLCFSFVARSSAWTNSSWPVGMPNTQALAVLAVPHPATVGPHVPQLLASPGNLVENDTLVQCLLQMLVSGTHAIWQRHDVHVIKEVFMRQQKVLKTRQGSMLPQGAQHGHVGIALPEVLGKLRIKLEHDRERCVTPADLVESIQHHSSISLSTALMAVNGERHGTTVEIRERLDPVRLHSPPAVWSERAEKVKLASCTAGAICWAMLLAINLRTKSPHTMPDATAWLLESNETLHSQQRKDVMRDFCSIQILSNLEESCCLRIRLQDQPHMFGLSSLKGHRQHHASKSKENCG